jgi:hypothetical protein
MRPTQSKIAAGFASYCAVAMGVLLWATADASWGATAIYKCFDRKSDVVYTDQPCKDGAPLDIQAGDADPVAVARLERVRDAFEQSASERIRDMRMIDAQRNFSTPWYSGPGPADYAMNSPYDDGGMWGLAGFGFPVFAHNRFPHGRPKAGVHAKIVAHSSASMGGRR